MTMPIDIEQKVVESRHRAIQYWFDDGIPELVVGVFFLLIASLGVVAEIAPPGSIWARGADLTLPLLVIGGVLAARWIIRRAKTRVSEPRTGYFRFRVERGRAWLRALWAVGIGAALAAAIVFSQATWGAWIYAFVQGGILALAFGLIAYRYRVFRFALLALLGAALPLLTVAVGWDQAVRDAMVFGGMGALLFLFGAWNFVRFVRRKPLTVEEADRG